ncbi:hypothetical protein JX265_004628 [Neoarthrinium moseri]|uniref:Cytochrome P450 n=1 Tax=Neoarthrinium moseri TaxID=1658444 RepID=A0A9Q0AR19_9PEZI|nr:hypothetical protein JX265_004628 [Neoarthrinium moseri]
MVGIIEDAKVLALALSGYFVAAISTYFVIFITYQIFLHPLSKYPGPFVAKLTDAYNGFFAYSKRLHLTTWQNQLKYGPVVRQGPNKLIFSSVTALRDIYKNDKITKPKAYMALGPGLTGYTVFTATDRRLHRARRQLIGQVLTNRSMRTFEPVMIEQVNIYLQKLLAHSQCSQPVEMTKITRQLGFNIAGILGFGYDLGLQTEETNQFMLPMLDAGTLWSSVFLQYPGARRFRLALVTVHAFRTLREKYLGIIEKMISSRTALAKDAKHDLYSFVSEALNDQSDNGLRQSDLWGEANLFLTAAGDTTKTAMSAAFFYLTRNPDCYQRLADEIRTTFSAGSEIQGSALTSCQYLRACIDETLRMSPPASGTLWRELSSDSGDQSFIVDGHVIPRGTIVGVSTYSIHHSEDYFPDSFAFRPERWIDDSITPEVKQIMREAFTPFSVGPRSCAGTTMAYMEVGLTIAKTLWYFDFEPAPGRLGHIGAGSPALGKGRQRPGEFQIYDVFSATHEGPYLVFNPRDGGGLKDLETKE